MFAIIGIFVVFAAVIGGFLMEKGHIGVLVQPAEFLILVGAAGLSYEEAADICGCALGTIKSRVNRARARLLKVMDIGDAAEALMPIREGASIGA